MNERADTFLRNRRRRAAAYDVKVARPADLARRRRLERNDCRWLSHYLPDIFGRQWTPTRKELVSDIARAVGEGGLIAAAGTRGEGKTMIACGVALKLIVTGKIKVVLLVGATGPFATRMLENIKFWMETSDPLAADYPEVCDPIRALEGSATRARTQTVGGKRTRMLWAGPYVILPTVTKSRASGAVIGALGIDGAIRGFNVRGARPDLVIVDDPDTRDSARSIDQTAKRAEIIETDIAGLGAGENAAAIVMLCNVPTRICIGAMFTDRRQKPAWRGRRYSLVTEWPQRGDLWDEYVRLRTEELSSGETLARQADRYYLQHRKSMDAGVKLSNPDRYNGQAGEDGRPLEYSALQSVYNLVADRGWHYVLCELQCDPPEDETGDAQLLVEFVRSQTCGLRRGELPDDIQAVTIGVDVGKFQLHWCKVAWLADATGYVVDYNTAPVLGTSPELTEGIEFAIMQAIERFCGQHCPEVNHTLIDSGYKPDAVFRAIAGLQNSSIAACKGTGDELTQSDERRLPARSTRFSRLGDHWAMNYQTGRRQWLTLIDSDFWKHWVRDRLQTAEGCPGAMRLCAADNGPLGNHQAFAEHICAEMWDPAKQKWVARKRNHWSDALYYAAAAASICGVRLFRPTMPQKPRKLSDIQKEKRARHGQK